MLKSKISSMKLGGLLQRVNHNALVPILIGLLNPKKKMYQKNFFLKADACSLKCFSKSRGISLHKRSTNCPPLQSVVEQVQFHTRKFFHRVEQHTHFNLLHALNTDNTINTVKTRLYFQSQGFLNRDCHGQ